jgi:hypothetical protein
MSDPHVQSLTYQLEVGETLTFNTPPPLDHDTEHFALRLENGTLTVSMKEHHSTTRSARDRVDPFLRSWELLGALAYGPGTLRFVFQSSDVIDSDPISRGRSHVLEAEAGMIAIVGMSAKLTVGRTTYIAPPTDFVASPDVITLWSRYQGYRERRELLPAMAYFCFTLLKARGDGVDGAAVMYQVHASVLRKLSELTSVRGDGATGRKFLADPQPFTPKESRWVEDVVRALIRRVGEHAAGTTQLRQLTTADFPPLK